MIQFDWAHTNLNVFDLERSLAFYEQALGLKVTKKIDGPEGSFKIVYLGDGIAPARLELTWLKDRDKPYNLGDNEIHIAYTTPSYEEAYKRHKEMGCNMFANKEMGIYFIEDPDGYWIEILPEKFKS